MNMHMIAAIYRGDERVGVRLLDADNKQITNLTDEMLIGAIESDISITNVEYTNGKIKGTNGDLSRYAKLDEAGRLIGNSAVVILFEVPDSNQYLVCNYEGKQVLLDEVTLIRYAKTNGIANGKITTKNDRNIISAISGNYSKLTIYNKPTDKTQAEKRRLTNEVTQDFLEFCQRNSIGDYEDVLKQCLEIEDALAKGEKALVTMYNRTPLLYNLLAVLDSGSNIEKAFGRSNAQFLIRFISEKLPIPKELVKECSSYASNNLENFYTTLFGEFNDTIRAIMNSSETTLYLTAKQYLTRVVLVELLGDYSEYTKDKLEQLNSVIYKFCICRDYDYSEMLGLVGTLNLIEEFDGDICELEDTVRPITKLYELAYLYLTTTNPKWMICTIEEKEALLTAIGANPKYYNSETHLYGATKLEEMPKKKLAKPLVYKNTSCGFISIPKKLGDNNKVVRESSIKDAYRKQVMALEVGQDVVVRRFREYCKYMQALQTATETIAPKADSERKITPNTSTSRGLTKAELEKRRVEAYKNLRPKLTSKHTSIAIKIADDLMSRHVTYKDMSAKQKFRFNQAVKELIEAYATPLLHDELYPSSAEDTEDSEKKKEYSKLKTYHNSDTNENKRYQLEEHKDIKDKIEKLLKKQDDVEMVPVLKEEPAVLKICLSVLNRRVATDKQLKHINNAVRLLDMQ